MADFHAADLWVAVVPETSQVGPAMEAAGKEAKGRFGQAVKDFGKSIHDDLDKIGDKAKDAFGRAGKTAKDSAREASAEMRNAFAGAFKDIPTSLDSTRQAFSRLDDLAKDVGIDISGWTKPAQNAEGAVKDLNDKALSDVAKNVSSVTSQFEGLPGKIGKAASAMTLFGGEIGAAVALLETIGPTLDKIDQKIHDSSGFGKWLEDLPKPEDWGNWLGEHLGAKQSRKFFGNLFGYDPELGKGGSNDPLPPGATRLSDGSISFGSASEPYPQNFIGPIPPGAVRAPNGVAPPVPGGGPSPSAGGSFYKDWYGAGASHSGNWDAVAGPEAGGNWHIDHGEGPDVTGGLQIATQTWLANGGGAFAPKAYMATPEQQKTIADRILATQGPGAWPVTSRNHPQWFKGGSGSPSAPGMSLPDDGGDFGASAGKPTIGPPDENSIRQWVQQNFGIANSFGTGSWENKTHGNDGGWHPKGYAFDFHSDDPSKMANLANWVANNYSKDTLELIYGGAGFDHNREIKNAKFGDVYGAGLNAEHRDHVHWAMTAPPWAGGRSLGRPGVSGTMPTGAEHDPLYVTSTGPGGQSAGAGSPFQSQGQQLGQGLVNGLLQMVGLDGSVFGGKSPLDWGAVKLGGGLLNWGLGTMQSQMSGPMGAPGLGGGGGGGMLSGLAGLIPHPGPMVSAGVGAAGGSLSVKDAVGGSPQVHNDNRVIVSGNTIKDNSDLVQRTNWEQNSRAPGYMGGLPAERN